MAVNTTQVRPLSETDGRGGKTEFTASTVAPCPADRGSRPGPGPVVLRLHLGRTFGQPCRVRRGFGLLGRLRLPAAGIPSARRLLGLRPLAKDRSGGRHLCRLPCDALAPLRVCAGRHRDRYPRTPAPRRLHARPVRLHRHVCAPGSSVTCRPSAALLDSSSYPLRLKTLHPAR